MKIHLLHKPSRSILSFDVSLARVRRLRRRIRAWANSVFSLKRRYRFIRIDLTYRLRDDWRPNHIREFMISLKKLLGSRLIAYAWVAELQKRGAVHYHIVIVVSPGTRIPFPDSSGMWPHGSTKVEAVRSPFYLIKYAQKLEQKAEGGFPKGLRLFAVVLSSSLKDFQYRLSLLPFWAVVIADSLGIIPRRCTGGFLFDGKFFQSPFSFLGVSP